MGETFWGETRVGDRAIMGLPGTEDEGTIVLSASAIPDWVRIPPEVAHRDAGKRCRVRYVVQSPCPCPAHHGTGTVVDVPTLHLDGSALLVAMCRVSGWCVYERG